MAKKVIYICDLCEKESMEDSSFENEQGIKGNGSISVEGFSAARGKGGHQYKEDTNLVCWECMDKVVQTMNRLKDKCK